MLDIDAGRVSFIRQAIRDLQEQIGKGQITIEQVRDDPGGVLGGLQLTAIEIMLVLREEAFFSYLECSGALTCLNTVACLRTLKPGPLRVFEPPAPGVNTGDNS